MKKNIILSTMLLLFTPIAVLPGVISCANSQNYTFSYTFTGCDNVEATNTKIISGQNFVTNLLFDDKYAVSSFAVFCENKQLEEKKDYIFDLKESKLVVFSNAVTGNIRASFAFTAFKSIPYEYLIIENDDDNHVALKGIKEGVDISKYTTLSIPNDVEVIAPSAFFNKFNDDSNIENIFFGANLIKIGDYAFANCTKLNCKLNFNEKLNLISKYAFYGCKNISSELVLPNNITEIGDYAFYNCTTISGTLTIPDEITIIRSNAFMCCTGISRIIFGSKLKTIEDFAFSSCTGIVNTVNIPDNVQIIGKSSFAGCKNLPEVNFSTTTLGISINDYAFQNCSSITALTIPQNIDGLGIGAFKDCTELRTVVFINDSKLKNISDMCFENCKELVSVTFPSQTLTIGKTAFAGCTKLFIDLSSLTNLQFIDDYAFARCNALGQTGTITLPNNLVKIGTHIFQNAFTEKTIVLPNSLQEISKEALVDLVSSIKIDFSSSKLKIIGERCFQGNSFPDKIIFPNTLTSIEPYAFYSCDIHDCVVFPDNFSTIKQHSFEHIKTGKIRLPQSDCQIEPYAFYQSTFDELDGGLRKVKTIGKSAFMDCALLKGGLNFNNVTTIEDYAFMGCENLDGPITFTTSIEKIGVQAFRRCWEFSCFDFTNINFLQENLPDWIVNHVENRSFDGVDYNEHHKLVTLSAGIDNFKKIFKDVKSPLRDWEIEEK